MAQPEAGAAPDRTIIEILLRRDVAITATCLLVLVLLSWWWLWQEATRMASMSGMTAMPDMPDMDAMTMMPPDPWSGAYLVTAFLMWAIMMVAMMLPSASPMILLHARFARRSGSKGADSLLFLLSYLVLWAIFALAAALGQAALLHSGLLTGMSLALDSRQIAAVLLIAAGAYQFSPVKQSCLSHCRSPLSFLMRHWRPGRAGAVRMGLRHGLYCLGCCALLMLLLFVGGVMNLGWIALLTIIVMTEKFSPAWLRMDRFLASGLLILGFAMLALSTDIFPIASGSFLS